MVVVQEDCGISYSWGCESAGVLSLSVCVIGSRIHVSIFNRPGLAGFYGTGVNRFGQSFIGLRVFS